MQRSPKLPAWWGALMARFNRLETLLTAERTDLMAFIDDLEAKVAAEKTVDDSVLALLETIVAQLKAAGADPVRQAAVLASLQAEQDRLAAAVTANTPAAPPAP